MIEILIGVFLVFCGFFGFIFGRAFGKRWQIAQAREEIRLLETIIENAVGAVKFTSYRSKQETGQYIPLHDEELMIVGQVRRMVETYGFKFNQELVEAFINSKLHEFVDWYTVHQEICDEKHKRNEKENSVEGQELKEVKEAIVRINNPEEAEKLRKLFAKELFTRCDEELDDTSVNSGKNTSPTHMSSDEYCQSMLADGSRVARSDTLDKKETLSEKVVSALLFPEKEAPEGLTFVDLDIKETKLSKDSVKPKKKTQAKKHPKPKLKK